ncbi:hypothetical protein VF14_26870 [Nostoc linckia z18]|uniref:Uncharacterized protein n=2 Tax=Nostoc linckia TaxID=92942 RepID=A0A9Q5Z948_NOSLI|nr:hypothetical protein [Nostoc linckia]PHK38795.1 hypothetical protein VF12_16865 [Nostoc linckia z15]PHK44313.1 hypothetical protein VF13_22545 [Nostoc linckia z16]PHJ62793.1 hypothetical protein VF02_16725 [Nostoc linckia z1]PHJ66623.1 hypothetical protein VF05_19000 [Nostoc linckia z3]PHJ72744.1 hypothetical protein VF03_18100 [Nostoc linckia z2]
MGKRFNNLNAALKYLRPPGANDTTEIPDAPSGSQLRQFQDYKAGKRMITYTRSTTSNPGDIAAAALKPFALPAANTNSFLVDISQRAITNFTAAGLSAAELNIDTTPEGITNLTKVNGFTPARATVKNVTGTTATTKTSKITGDTYKSKAGASYTYPFGRSTDDPSYSEVKAAIAAAVAAASGNKGVSFKPEIYR